MRANWGDLHGIVNANTFTAAAAQMVAAAMPGAQVLPVPPPMPPAAPQAAPMPPSAPLSGSIPTQSPIGLGRMLSTASLVPSSTSASVVSRSVQRNRTSTATRVSKQSGQLPNGSAIRNVATYPDAKVKPSDRLEGDWGPTLAGVRRSTPSTLLRLPSSFTRPPAYVR